ncbi:MAG: hypothetical protein GEU98_27080 [Pseudonocardiaceae bacterium]|nr:hypothetical protein [Pseudonocardiaceae bacterium]
MLLVVLAVTVTAAILARNWYGEPDGASAGTGIDAGESSVPGGEPGPSAVRLTSDARAHPLGENVRRLLSDYFAAINKRDYERWTRTVTTDRVQSLTEQQWLDNYETTKDGSIRVYRIESAPGNTLRVLLGFTSTQDRSQAPADLPVGCIRWRLSLPVAKEAGQWKIDELEPGTKQEKQRC